MATQSSNPLESSLYRVARNFDSAAPTPAVSSLPRDSTRHAKRDPRIWAESAGKRGFDLLGASVGLLLSLPVLGAIAVCIKLTSPGPIFFRQERVGKHQVLFTIYKFRTMQVRSEEQGPTVTRNCDRRMTKIGSLLRRFKLDELPQFFNVIRGDMSLVGPRPKLECHERMQMICKPGITGAATIVFAREEILLMDVPEELCEEFTVNVLNEIKAKIDTEYVRKSTFRSDVELILATTRGSKGQKSITNLNELFQTYGNIPLPQGRHRTFGD
jgi:lipopolysaccharide/colanic/teichoic acid biosynthesis glycosyltransferase